MASLLRRDRMWGAWEDREWLGFSAARGLDDDDEVEIIAGAGNGDSAARDAAPRSEGPAPTMPVPPQEHDLGGGEGDNGPRRRPYAQLSTLSYAQLISTVLLVFLPLILICVFTIGRGDNDPTLEPENVRNIHLPKEDGVNEPIDIANVQQKSASSPAQRTLDLIAAEGDYIDNELFLYENPSTGWVPSTIYDHKGLKKASGV